MKKEKIISSIFLLLLTLSLFSILVIAQEDVEESTDLIGSDQIEIIDQEEENEDEEESDLDEIKELIEEKISNSKQTDLITNSILSSIPMVKSTS